MSNPDVLVAGAGAIGALTALELAGAGLKVTVIDQGRAARESSWAGGGILSPLYPWRYSDAVTALAEWGKPRFQSATEGLAAETGVDPQWHAGGMLVRDVDDAAQARAWAERWSVSLSVPEPGAHGVEGLGPSQGADIWMPDIAQLRTPRFGKALRAALQGRNIELLENTRLDAIRTDAGRVTGACVNGRDLSVGSVVLATGAWTGALGAEFGLDLNVYPVKGQMLLFKAHPELLDAVVLGADRYLIPRRDGRILIGSTLEHEGFEKQTTASAADELRAVAVSMLPALADYPVEHHWAGLRPGKDTPEPWIGPVPGMDGLWVNAGHFRNGMVLSLGSAHLLRQLFLGETPHCDPTPYRPGA
ncbi:MAG: NAD(P)/FAD-dependent oxidoreductase [Gammaproteobacteria bacterium]